MRVRGAKQAFHKRQRGKGRENNKWILEAAQTVSHPSTIILCEIAFGIPFGENHLCQRKKRNDFGEAFGWFFLVQVAIIAT
jgi:hypothetical protein